MRQEVIKCNMALEMLSLLNTGRRLGGGVDNDFIKEMQAKFECNIIPLENEPQYRDLQSRYRNFLNQTGNTKQIKEGV